MSISINEMWGLESINKYLLKVIGERGPASQFEITISSKIIKHLLLYPYLVGSDQKMLKIKKDEFNQFE